MKYQIPKLKKAFLKSISDSISSGLDNIFIGKNVFIAMQTDMIMQKTAVAIKHYTTF